MALTVTTAAAATVMRVAVVAPFLILAICFSIFLCARRYHGVGGAGRGGADEAWSYKGGLDDKSMAKLPRQEVGQGEALGNCVICITELAAGETARVLPRCRHGFHVGCIDMWLRSNSTCPLCRSAAVDDPPVPPAVAIPEADPGPRNFPTNLLFFGSQDEVSICRSL